MDEEPTKIPSKLKTMRLPSYALGISLLTLLFVITTKDPGGGGPIMILFFLFWVFLACLSLWALILQGITHVFALQEFSWMRLLYTSVALAAGSVFLVGLQTLRQLQLIDLILLGVFELVLNFYLLRRF